MADMMFPKMLISVPFMLAERQVPMPLMSICVSGVIGEADVPPRSLPGARESIRRGEV